MSSECCFAGLLKMLSKLSLRMLAALHVCEAKAASSRASLLSIHMMQQQAEFCTAQPPFQQSSCNKTCCMHC